MYGFTQRRHRKSKRNKGLDLDIVLDREVKDKIDAWTKIASGEVSALGAVKPIRKGSKVSKLNVCELFLLEQEGSSGSTEIDGTAAAKLLYEIEEKYDDEEEVELRFWWHSHANMPVFWSGTDTSTIDDLFTPPYLISLVSNKKGKHRLRLDIQSDLGRLVFDKLDFNTQDREVPEEYKEEFEEKVDESSTSVSVHTSGRYSGRYSRGRHRGTKARKQHSGGKKAGKKRSAGTINPHMGGENDKDVDEEDIEEWEKWFKEKYGHFPTSAKVANKNKGSKKQGTHDKTQEFLEEKNENEKANTYGQYGRGKTKLRQIDCAVCGTTNYRRRKGRHHCEKCESIILYNGEPVSDFYDTESDEWIVKEFENLKPGDEIDW